MHEMTESVCGGLKINIQDERACCKNSEYVNCKGRACKNYEGWYLGSLLSHKKLDNEMSKAKFLVYYLRENSSQQ